MVEFTGEQAVEMEAQFIAGFKTKEFQELLWKGHQRAGSDELARMKEKVNATWTIQEKVLANFGFEATRKGLQQSVLAVGNVHINAAQSSDPADQKLNKLMDDNHEIIEWLTNPSLQEKDWYYVPDAEVPRPAPPSEEEQRAKGSKWKVIEDQHPLVRRSESLMSQPYKYRLAPGAMVKAMEDVKGQRLHYQKLSGDGPDYGWVSLHVGAKDLLVPVY